MRDWLKRYEDSTIAYFLRVIEPLGIVIAALGVLLAIGGFIVSWIEIREVRVVWKATLDEFQESRISREGGLLSLTLERIQAARVLDHVRDENGQVKKAAVGWHTTLGEYYACNTYSGRIKQFTARTGQIPLLETMVALDIPLRGIQMQSVNYVASQERSCALAGIYLAGADLVGAESSNSNLRCANLQGAKLIAADFSMSCLKSAILRRADLTRADLKKVDLSQADLSNACLAGAELQGARLKNADFSGADLTGLDLGGVDLSAVKNLEQGQLDQACASGRSKGLPKGLKATNGACPDYPICVDWPQRP